MIHDNRKTPLPRLLLEIAAGLLPFVLLGPMVVWRSYPYPPPVASTSTLTPYVSMLSLSAILLAGLVIGWFTRFPLWSYPYTVLAALVLLLGGLSFLTSPPENWQYGAPFYLTTAITLLLVIALVLATRKSRPWMALIEAMHADWTRLSFGLLVLPAFLFSSIDHDEDPVLTIFVIGPTIILVFTALAVLLVEGKKNRVLALLAGMVLALLVRLPSGSFAFIFWWVLAAIIVLAPLLFEIRQWLSRQVST